jgi:hypothetical protein
MAIRVIRAKDRYHHTTDWLSTYWHFSFDHYYDPHNVSFGPLRVFNDDTVQPATGFPPHSHADMEIVSYVLSGALEHRDSEGNRGVITAGELQVMSAGTGITHAESNPSTTDPVRFLQIWIRPRQRGHPPRWEQRAFPRDDRVGRLAPVVSGGPGDTLSIDQDATIYVGALRPGQIVTHPTEASRRSYLYVIDGDVRLDGDALAAGDQVRAAGAARLELEASSPADLLLIDLP